MRKIGEIFNVGMPHNDGFNFGVEIELEGINKHIPNLRHWNQEADGSLRDNGREFIFKQPFSLEKSEVALKELKDMFNEVNVKPKATNLTSTHIHIDVRDLTVQQLLHFVACIMVVEDDLAEASGEDRKNNYFALTTSESDHRKRELMDVRTDEDFKMFIRNQVRTDVRYCGINFNSIHRHGSLEMRYLGGQADPTKVLGWLQFYKRVKQLSVEGIDFEKLFQSISERGTQDAFDLFKPPFQLTQGNVIEGLRNAQDYVFRMAYKIISAPENGNGLADYYDKF